MVGWTNPRTGQALRIDKGLDPSWAGNPGLDRARVLADQLIGKLDAAEAALAREGIRQVLASPLLEHQLAPMQKTDPPKGLLPVGLLEPAGRRGLGAETSVVALTQRGARHLRKDHPDVTPDDIRRVLPALLRDGRQRTGTGAEDGLPYLRLDWEETAGATWRAVVKRDGHVVFLATLFRLGRPRRR